jgi:hypothetical protein
MASKNVRIIYHPSPRPDEQGQLVSVEPVDLGSDVPAALQWIRRRLGLRTHGTLLETARYLNEPLPLRDPSAIELADEEIAARPPTRRRLRRPAVPMLRLPVGGAKSDPGETD